jgi:predicted alpha/beta hydrolase
LPSLQAARFAIDAFSFSDDEAMTEGNTRTLLAAMPNAPSRVTVVAPADVGLVRIGHLGAFRPESAALWPRLEAALNGQRWFA